MNKKILNFIAICFVVGFPGQDLLAGRTDGSKSTSESCTQTDNEEERVFQAQVAMDALIFDLRDAVQRFNSDFKFYRQWFGGCSERLRKAFCQSFTPNPVPKHTEATWPMCAKIGNGEFDATAFLNSYGIDPSWHAEFLMSRDFLVFYNLVGGKSGGQKGEEPEFYPAELRPSPEESSLE